MRLGFTEGFLVSLLPPQQINTSASGVGQQGEGEERAAQVRWGLGGCSSLRRLLEQGFPFICYLHTLAIGIEFVPIKTKLALPGILNRLWQSSPLTLSERYLQIPPLHTGNHCKSWLFAHSQG